MLKLLKILTLLLSVLAITAGKAYDGYKIYDVIPSEPAQIAALQELAKFENDYDFFSISRLPGHAARVMVNPKAQANFQKLLQQQYFAYEIINENVGNTVEKEHQIQQLLRNIMPYAGRLTTDRYYSHAEINSFIEDLAKRYPERVFVKTVGKSFEGRLLKTILITNGDGRSNKNVIFMDGGFHAREWISPAAVIYAIEQLVEHSAEQAELLLDYDWLILPVVNADGYEYTQLSADTRFWRKTRQPIAYNGTICYGTDPNRNFDFHWNEDGSTADPCSNTFAGPKAFSEPEAVVVRDIMHSLQGRGKMYLTVHSYGNYILYPWGWSEEYPDTWRDLHEVAEVGANAIYEATGTNYTFGQSTIVLYVAAGASDDYAFNAGFPISFTMELPKGGSNGFNPPTTSIDALVKETWIGIRAMAKRVVQKYPLN